MQGIGLEKRRNRMGKKANRKELGVKSLVFVFLFAGGVRTAGNYAGITGAAECGVFDFHDGVFDAGFTVETQ